MTQEELIAALEAAMGPSRELDCYIHAETLRHRDHENSFATVVPPTYRETRYFFNPNLSVDWIGYDLLEISPAYTASLDAALTLLPEDYDWIIGRTNGGLTIHACCGGTEEHFAATPAIALCIAALKARAVA